MNIRPFFSSKPWGGEYISKLYNLDPSFILGEAFIVSTLANCEATVEGKNLSEHLQENLPYVIKVIDANENLSIQVHPNDEWAHKLEGSVGKTECWFVLDAGPGAGVYYGFKEGHNFETLMESIKNGENASSCLNFVQIKRGDFIVVPAGTIHAIGADVKILEFQQSSGITYRIWDWGREGRELHLEKAKLVTTNEAKFPDVKKYQEFDPSSVFFNHNDFNLQKVNEHLIVCFSDKGHTSFQVNVETLSCEIL